MNNSLHVLDVDAVETCVAAEDDVLMASSPGGKNMALYEVRHSSLKVDYNNTKK